MIERCLNYRRIKRLVDWPLVISSKYIYLLETLNGQDKGVWSFFVHPDADPVTGNGYVVHVDMQKDFRGKKVIESGKRAAKWIFKNTEADFIKAEIPKDRMHVRLIANRVGMTSIGIRDDFKYFQLMR